MPFHLVFQIAKGWFNKERFRRRQARKRKFEAMRVQKDIRDAQRRGRGHIVTASRKERV